MRTDVGVVPEQGFAQVRHQDLARCRTPKGSGTLKHEDPHTHEPSVAINPSRRHRLRRFHLRWRGGGEVDDEVVMGVDGGGVAGADDAG